MPVDLQPDEIENRVQQELPVPAPRYSLPPPSYERASNMSKQPFVPVPKLSEIPSTYDEDFKGHATYSSPR